MTPLAQKIVEDSLEKTGENTTEKYYYMIVLLLHTFHQACYWPLSETGCREMDYVLVLVWHNHSYFVY